MIRPAKLGRQPFSPIVDKPTISMLKIPYAIGVIPDPETVKFDSAGEVQEFAEHVLNLIATIPEDVEIELLEYGEDLGGWVFLSESQDIIADFAAANHEERVADDEDLMKIFADAVNKEVAEHPRRYVGTSAEELIELYSPHFYIDESGHFYKDAEVTPHQVRVSHVDTEDLDEEHY